MPVDLLREWSDTADLPSVDRVSGALDARPTFDVDNRIDSQLRPYCSTGAAFPTTVKVDDTWKLDAAGSKTSPLFPVRGAERKVAVFVDPFVKWGDALVSRLNSNAEIFVLDPYADGVAQIREYLAAGSYDRPYDAVHILSHGEPASIHLAASDLSLSTLSSHELTLGVIRSTLAEQADILLYGCRIGSGPEGREFVERLATITGADVAASDDLTGASSLGGDMEFEIRVGDISATAVLEQATFDNLEVLN